MSIEFIKHVNNVRTFLRLDPVTHSPECEADAEANAKRVARHRRRLWHPGSTRAEIAARGQRTIKEAIESWLNSPGHRAILLGSYRHCGVAKVLSKWGDIVWFAQFE